VLRCASIHCAAYWRASGHARKSWLSKT
jgi:hypothetical protein